MPPLPSLSLTAISKPHSWGKPGQMGAGEHIYHCLYNLSGIADHSLAALRAISRLAGGVPFSCTQKFLHAHFVSTYKLGAKMSASIFFLKPSCSEAIIKLPHSQWPRAPPRRSRWGPGPTFSDAGDTVGKGFLLSLRRQRCWLGCPSPGSDTSGPPLTLVPPANAVGKNKKP